MPDPITWQSIRDAALARIRSGTWPPGQLIPTEAELAREFNCARMTVSRALRHLAEDGVLDRRRRAGTRVAQTPVRRVTLSIPILRHEVEARGAAYRHAVLHHAEEPAPPSVTARMALAPGTSLLHVETLHLADGQPHASEDRWVNLAAVPDLAGADLETISVNEWLVGNAWYTHGDISFGAEAATAALAARLSVPEGAPLLTMDRATWMHADPVTAVRLSYPPAHRLTMSL